MQIATRNGDVNLLKVLIKNGGNVHTRGPNGESLLHIASYYGHLDIVKYLINHNNIPTSTVDNQGRTLLHIAASNGKIDILKYCHVTLNLDFTIKDYNQFTPMDCIPNKQDKYLLICKEFIVDILFMCQDD